MDSLQTRKIDELEEFCDAGTYGQWNQWFEISSEQLRAFYLKARKIMKYPDSLVNTRNCKKNHPDFTLKLEYITLPKLQKASGFINSDFIS